MTSSMVLTIICPHCSAEVDCRHEVCPHCHRSLRADGTAPPADSDLADSRWQILERPWMITVLLLHVGFLGIPLYWKTRYSVQTRLLICALSIAYTVFAVGVIVGVGMYLYRQLLGA